MKMWLRRIRGTFVMGLTWAVAWAPLGILIGFVVDRDGKMDEPWLMVGTLPGFLCAFVFSIALWISEGGGRPDAITLPRAARLGALSGLVVSLLPFVLGTPNPNLPWWFSGVLVASLTLMGTASSVGTVWLARDRTAVQTAEEREVAE